MPSTVMSPLFRRLFLVVTIVVVNLATASATPVPAMSDAQVLDCPQSATICEGDGVTVTFLGSGTSADLDILWSLAQITLQPGADVQPSAGDSPTLYSVSVEQGTVGLTASAPVTCFGACEVETTLPPATPAGAPASGVVIPAGMEVLLAPGDLVTFEEAPGTTHVYRNAGDDEAHVSSTVYAPSTAGRCYGRCLDGF